MAMLGLPGGSEVTVFGVFLVPILLVLVVVVGCVYAIIRAMKGGKAAQARADEQYRMLAQLTSDVAQLREKVDAIEAMMRTVA